MELELLKAIALELDTGDLDEIVWKLNFLVKILEMTPSYVRDDIIRAAFGIWKDETHA